jgi:glycosyltransferase involved in cell wall biosynthesis
MNISFVICCNNSASRLAPTLAHLAALDVRPDLAWEVVVVDNASTDDTAAVARRCWTEAGAPAPLRVVSEPVPGLVHARRRGLHEARHEVLCFVDDDNWLGPNWADVLDEIFTSRPDVGAVGGLGRPVFEGAEPPWFSRVAGAYAVGPQAPSSGEVPAKRGYLYGAGLAVRRAAFLDLDRNGFHPSMIGRRGRELLAGDDSELCFALTLTGWRLWYDARLEFAHFIPATRLQRAYVVRLIEQLGYASASLDAYAVAGAAARSRLWVAVNRLYLPRLIVAGLKYFAAATSARMTRGDDLRSRFLGGRFRGAIASDSFNAALRRSRELPGRAM